MYRRQLRDGFRIKESFKKVHKYISYNSTAKLNSTACILFHSSSMPRYLGRRITMWGRGWYLLHTLHWLERVTLVANTRQDSNNSSSGLARILMDVYPLTLIGKQLLNRGFQIIFVEVCNIVILIYFWNIVINRWKKEKWRRCKDSSSTN